MKQIALRLIRLYQRYLSPRKGYACAFRVHHGRDSCSAYGYRCIDRHGLLQGCLLLRRRLRACAQVACDCRASRPAYPRQRLRQAGNCDVPCDLPGCDVDLSQCVDLDVVDTLLDMASCGCDGCNYQRPSRRQLKVPPAP
ncbi:MAG: membrane protein insertion efficiency factor YidD [Sphingomonadaceae bacterium]